MGHMKDVHGDKAGKPIFQKLFNIIKMLFESFVSEQLHLCSLKDSIINQFPRNE